MACACSAINGQRGAELVRVTNREPGRECKFRVNLRVKSLPFIKTIRNLLHRGSTGTDVYSYSQTTLISRSTVLNSGSPVYISAFSRLASAAAKQSAKDIFLVTFNSPASSDILGPQELSRGVVTGAGVALRQCVIARSGPHPLGPDMTIWVVPSLYALFSCNTTWPARLRLSRSLDPVQL